MIASTMVNPFVQIYYGRTWVKKHVKILIKIALKYLYGVDNVESDKVLFANCYIYELVEQQTKCDYVEA